VTPEQAFKEVEKAARSYANGCELDRVQRIDEALKVLRAALAGLHASEVTAKPKRTS
jgi:hypothetical protein